MDPLSAAGSVAQLGSAALNAYGAAKERKMRDKAAQLAQKGVGELQGGKGYKADDALKFLGLTDQSAMEGMDPTAKGASMTALQNLVNRGSGTGLDVQSKQALSDAMGRTGAAQNAARQAVLQEYQSRGAGGSGAELGAALAGQQANYGQLAGATGAAAADAENRRLQANTLAAREGQSQQGLEQSKAQALDTLQRFNVGAKQNTLGLEQSYRQGAAGAYQGAANTMAGMAPQAGAPYATGGKALQSAVGPVNTLMGMIPSGGGQNAEPQGSSWGEGWGSGKAKEDPTAGGTW